MEWNMPCNIQNTNAKIVVKWLTNQTNMATTKQREKKNNCFAMLIKIEPLLTLRKILKIK